MKKITPLNNANKAQQALMRELSSAANACPPVTDREGFEAFQRDVLQPIRDRIIAAGDKE